MFERSRNQAVQQKAQQRQAEAQRLATQSASAAADATKSAALDMDVDILHAFMEGASWAEAFDSYFIGFCPEFATFEVGGEYMLQQTDIHLNFVRTAESLLDQQLAAQSISADTFLKQVMGDIKTTPPDSAAARAAQAVMQRLEECANFERFGAMMRHRYDVINGSAGALTGGTAEDDQNEEPAAPAGTAATGDGAAVTQVRRSFFVYYYAHLHPAACSKAALGYNQ